MAATKLWGICGGSGSGKSTLASALIDQLGSRGSILSLDSYYNDLGHLSFEQRCGVNFDHPDSLDIELFCQHLDQLSKGEPIEVPTYDFSSHNRAPGTTRLAPGESGHIVVVDGILLMGIPEVRSRLDQLVFLDVPAELRLERRVERDVAERGRIAEEVRDVFAAVVRPMELEFLDPMAGFATVTIAHPFAPAATATHLIATLA